MTLAHAFVKSSGDRIQGSHEAQRRNHSDRCQEALQTKQWSFWKLDWIWQSSSGSVIAAAE